MAMIEKFGVIYNELEREKLSEELVREGLPEELTEEKKRLLNTHRASTENGSCSKDLSELLENEDIQYITDCEKHMVRRFSFPSLHAGCLIAGTNSDSPSIDIVDNSLQTVNVRNGQFESITNPVLTSGGTVIYHELAKHISVPNTSVENPIVLNWLPEDFKMPPVAPVEELKDVKQVRKLCRSFSGGGIVEDTSSKVNLPYLYSFHQPKTTPNFRRSLSGGWITNHADADHVIVSDILSNTWKCGEKSEIGHYWKVTDAVSEYTSGQEKSETETETDQQIEGDFKKEPNVTTEEKNQIPNTEISRMVEEISECYNTQRNV